MEQETFRDDKGRLQAGHPGLKKKGDIHAIAGDIRDKLADFLQAHIDELPGIWKNLPEKDKVKLFVDVAAFVLPKQKDINMSIDTEALRKATADLFPEELTNVEATPTINVAGRETEIS